MLFQYFLLTLIIATAPFATAQRPPSAQDYTKIDDCSIIPNPSNDGDSFHVRANGKEMIFRLYFVDSPESETDSQVADRITEQAAYFGISEEKSIQLGKEAAKFTERTLSGKFTVYTRFNDALGRSNLPRYYAFVKVGGDYLQDILIANGWARIYGTKTPLPDGRDSRVYEAHLQTLEQKAKSQGLGGWGGKTKQTRVDPVTAANNDFFSRAKVTPTPLPIRQTPTPPVVTPTPEITKPVSVETPPPSDVSNLVDLNNATAEELEALPKIGKVTAARIIEARPLTSVEDLRDIQGIKQSAFEVIAPLVYVK